MGAVVLWLYLQRAAVTVTGVWRVNHKTQHNNKQ